MGRRATINDVAAAAGVSVSTVSKAVHGRYGVAPDTMRRVLEVVERLGYQSSLGASSMRSHRTGVIGVLVPAFEPFSAEILKGVGAAVRGTGFDLLAYSGSQDGTGEGWERRSVSRLSGTLIDGVIMVTPSVVNVSGGGADRRDRPAHRSRRPADGGIGQLPRRAAGDPLPDRARATPASASSPAGPTCARPCCAMPATAAPCSRRASPFDPALVGVGRYQEDASRETRARPALARATDRPRSSPRTISRRSRCWGSPPSWASRCPTSCR